MIATFALLPMFIMTGFGTQALPMAVFVAVTGLAMGAGV